MPDHAFRGAAMLIIVGLLWSLPGSPLHAGPRLASASAPLLVLYHSDDTSGRLCYNHLRQTLAYAKTPYDTFDLATSSSLPALASYRAVAVTTERLETLSGADARRLRQYVANGGGLAVLFRSWHPLLAEALGHPTAFAPDFTVLPNATVRLSGHLMPAATDVTLDSLSLSILDFQTVSSPLIPSATVLARTDRPIAWTRRYGQGRTLFWNADLLTTKPFRGALLQSIVAVQSYTVRPLANWGAIYLDDFPSPGVPSHMEPIASELGLSAAAFYATRWYPDMRRLADRFGLTYTSTAIFAYNGVVTPPFRFQEWLTGRVVVDGQVVYYAPWIARWDGTLSEMALHGYNHQSLLTGLWPSPQAMREALDAAHHRWQLDAFAPLPTTYVPPMNQVDSTGLQALRAAFPTLNTVAGLYGGDFALGQDREFGPDPWNDRLYALPRNTSGYILSDPLRLSMVSLLEVVGVWGHFVHPDEVYPNRDRYQSMRALGIQIPDEGFAWYGAPERDGLYYQFREWLSFAERHYSWLRYMTARDARAAMQDYEALVWDWEAFPDHIRIHASDSPAYFAVHVPPATPIVAVVGGTLLQRVESPLFTKIVVEARAPSISIQFAPSANASLP